MELNQWLDDKPEFTDECLVIAANEIRGEWEYTLYQIRKLIDDDGNWYLGWLTSDGEEYGDLNDFKAQKYMIIKPIA